MQTYIRQNSVFSTFLPQHRKNIATANRAFVIKGTLLIALSSHKPYQKSILNLHTITHLWNIMRNSIRVKNRRLPNGTYGGVKGRQKRKQEINAPLISVYFLLDYYAIFL